MTNKPTGRTPAEQEEWITGKALAADVSARAAVGAMVREGIEAYSGSLTAAGDPAAMDIFNQRYELWVRDFGTVLAEMHLSGAVVATLTLPGTLATSALTEFVSVVNENALAYQAQATNRIVNASQGVWQEVRERTVASVRSGLPVETLAREVEAITGYAESRAAAIARTETIGAYNGGEMDGARALGADGPSHKQWLSATDARTREAHLDADGQIVALAEPFLVDGEPMDRPVDPAGSAANVVNCRCSVVFLYPDDPEVEALGRTDAVPTPKTQAELDAEVRPDPVPAPAPAPAAPRASSQELDDAVARNDALRAEIAAIEAQNEALRLEYEGLTAAVDAPKMSGVIVAALVEGDGTVTYADGDVAPLHQTLAYLGTVDDLADGDRDTIVEAVEALAASMAPFDGYVCGVASLGPDGDRVALTEAPELQAAHDAIVDNGRTSELHDAHNAHPSWISHITFGDGGGWSFGDVVRFDRLAVFVGDERVVVDL
jgi:hypothetical protein